MRVARIRSVSRQFASLAYPSPSFDFSVLEFGDVCRLELFLFVRVSSGARVAVFFFVMPASCRVFSIGMQMTYAGGSDKRFKGFVCHRCSGELYICVLYLCEHRTLNPMLTVLTTIQSVLFVVMVFT